MDGIHYTLSKEDWSLYQKVDIDQLRHKELISKAIRNNLPDIISKESVILSGENTTVKVTLESLKEYNLVFNIDKQKFIGMGNGNSLIGDVIAKDEKYEKAGNKYIITENDRGQEIFETEITIDEIEEILFTEFELPNLVNKSIVSDIKRQEYFCDVRKTGLMCNLDKKRTILENIKRNYINKDDLIKKISVNDLRFLDFEVKKSIQTNTVIIAIIDTSGSMGLFEKYIARTFYFWMVRFIRTKYEFVEVVFITHNTTANEVNEVEFFSKVESGGTICSSGYKKAVDIIKEKYPTDKYNIYLFHFSDGDNLSVDNELCLEYVNKLLTFCNMFCYGEINNYNRKSTLMSLYKTIKNEKFKYFIIKQKSEIYKALTTFFSNN